MSRKIYRMELTAKFQIKLLFSNFWIFFTNVETFNCKELCITRQGLNLLKRTTFLFSKKWMKYESYEDLDNSRFTYIDSEMILTWNDDYSVHFEKWASTNVVDKQ